MKNKNGITIFKSRKPTFSNIMVVPNWKLPELTVTDLYRRQEGKCFYCNSDMSNMPWSVGNPEGYTKDHFFPKSLHSKNKSLQKNMVLACRICNTYKSNDTPTKKEFNRFKRLYKGNHNVK